MTVSTQSCGSDNLTEQLELLRLLIDEGNRALAAFDFPRFEQIAVQQGAATRGILRLTCLPASSDFRPEDESKQAPAAELVRAAGELRKSAGLYARILRGTSRTLAAFLAARQASEAQQA